MMAGLRVDGTLCVDSIHEGSIRSICFFRELSGSFTFCLIRVKTRTDYVTNLSADDSQRLVTGSADSNVRIINFVTGELLVVLSGHRDEVNTVTVSSSGKWILSGGDDGACRVWDTENSCLTKWFSPHDGVMIYCAKISKDETKCISCSMKDYAVRVFSFPDGEALMVLTGHTSALMSLDIDETFSRAISGSWDNTARVWNLNSGDIEWVLDRHEADCNAVAISPNGRKAVTASDDRLCLLWDLETGTIVREFRGHESIIVSVSFKAVGDSYRIVTGSWDSTCRFYDEASSDEGSLLVKFSNKACAVQFNPSGALVAMGSFNSQVVVKDLHFDDRKRVFALIGDARLPKDTVRAIKEMLFIG